VAPVEQTSQVGKYLVDGSQSDDGRIVLAAITDASVSSADILQVLRFAYAHLKPRQTAAAASTQ